MKQYTLRTLLLFTLFVGLTLAYGLLWYQHNAAIRELEMLRTELGILTDVDLDSVSFIEVPTNERDVWRWRIYVPEGTHVDIGILTKEIPMSGTPEPSITGAFFPSNPKGTLVTAAIRKSVGEGYDLILNLGNSALGSSKEERELESWHDGGGELTVAGRGGTRTVKLGESIILVRKRLMEQVSNTTSQVPSGLSRGYMFWIRPHKSP